VGAGVVNTCAGAQAVASKIARENDGRVFRTDGSREGCLNLGLGA